ncbi:hypothetical protein EDC04DRAFT_1755591 [Pisolithus marmoratus]|nr:hypothetical protein EDC04DRAFT_1755591 [Pisolithus marmoratus]
MYLAQFAFIVMPLVTLIIGGTISRNAEGLSSLQERQTPSCPCASLNMICDASLPSLCCSNICAASASSVLPNMGTCSCNPTGTTCTVNQNCCSGQCTSIGGGFFFCE